MQKNIYGNQRCEEKEIPEEKLIVELPKSVVKWLKCLAEWENKSLENILKERIIEMVASDLDNTEMVVDIIGYSGVVGMGLDRDLLSLGFNLLWLKENVKKD